MKKSVKKVTKKRIGKKRQPKKSGTELLELEAITLINATETMKKLYRRLDEITETLEARGFKEGKHLRLVDNFADKNVVFRTTSVKRFHLESK